MPDPAAIERARAALDALDDDALDAAVRALGHGEHLGALAQALAVDRTALASHPTPGEPVRTRLARAAPARLARVALALAGPCADDCIDALGEASDNPARDDMLAVLPSLIERHGTPTVTLMLAAYPTIDAPCTAVFEGLLIGDERFTIPPPAATRWATPAAPDRLAGVVVDEAAVERIRREREARIAAEVAKRRRRRR